MKHSFFVILAFVILFANTIFAQSGRVIIPYDTANFYIESDTNKIYTYADFMPQFPGGDDSLNAFVRRNAKFPEKAFKDGISGKVWFTFVIDTQGRLKNVKVLSSLRKDCDMEGLRVISLMPNWIPGMRDGKKVEVNYNFPMEFVIHKK
jgi:protein TonB